MLREITTKICDGRQQYGVYKREEEVAEREEGQGSQICGDKRRLHWAVSTQ